MTDDLHRKLRFLAQIAAWTLLFFVMFSTLSPISLRPETGHVTLERFGAYALVGGAFTLGYPSRWVAVALGLLTVAGVLEALQTLEPDRHGRWLDLLVKVAGTFSGVGAGLVCVALLAAWAGPRRLANRAG